MIYVFETLILFPLVQKYGGLSHIPVLAKPHTRIPREVRSKARKKEEYSMWANGIS